MRCYPVGLSAAGFGAGVPPAEGAGASADVRDSLREIQPMDFIAGETQLIRIERFAAG